MSFKLAIILILGSLYISGINFQNIVICKVTSLVLFFLSNTVLKIE
jgi:hypothetical protein